LYATILLTSHSSILSGIKDLQRKRQTDSLKQESFDDLTA